MARTIVNLDSKPILRHHSVEFITRQRC
jgi:hypothetical protein